MVQRALALALFCMLAVCALEAHDWEHFVGGAPGGVLSADSGSNGDDACGHCSFCSGTVEDGGITEAEEVPESDYVFKRPRADEFRGRTFLPFRPPRG